MNVLNLTTPTSPTAPVLEIGLEPRLTGGHQTPIPPRSFIDQGSGRLVLTQEEEHVSLWDRAVYESADWSVILTLFAVPILLWMIWRVMCVPRTPGRVNCRKCAYDLTPTTATVIDRCPECGVLTSRHKPVLGKSLARRLAVPLMLLVCIPSITALNCFLTLRPSSPFAGGRRWPPLVSSYLPAWAVRQHREPVATYSARIDIWSIRDKQLLRTIRPNNNSGDAWSFSSVCDVRLIGGGELLAFTTLNPGVCTRIVRVSDGQVLWERQTPQTLRARLEGVAGSTPDGSRVFVWTVLQAADGAKTTEVTVEEITLQTGASRPLGSLTLDHVPEAWGYIQVFAALGDDGPQWVCVEAIPGGGNLIWPGKRVMKTPLLRFDHAVVRGGPRGPVLLVPVQGRSSVSQSAWQVPLDGSEPVTIPYRQVGGSGATVTISSAQPNAAPVTLATGGSAASAIFQVAPGDRWMTLWVDHVRPPLFQLPGGGGTLPRMHGTIQVWEIAPPSSPAPAPVRSDK